MRRANNTEKVNLFETVLRSVKKGMNVTEACHYVGCSRASLYYQLTEEQKWELRSYKMISVKSKRHGIGAIQIHL